MSDNDSPTPATPTTIIPIGIPLSTSRKRGSKGMEDEDSIVIVNALLNFKAQHGGSNPTPTTIGPLLDAVQHSLHNQLTSDQLYNRLRSLKNKYLRATIAGGPGPTEVDRTFFDLAVKAWGVRSADVEEKKPDVTVAQNGNGVAHDHDDDDEEIMDEDEDDDGDHDLKVEGESDDDDEEEEEEEEEDDDDDDDNDDRDEEFDLICESYKYLARGMKEVWETEGLSLTALKLGMKNMDKEKAKELDNKWKLHFRKGLEIEARKLTVQHKLADALASAIRDNKS